MKKIMTYVVPRLQKMHDTGARFTCVNGSIAAGKESSAGFSNCFDGSNADNAMGGCGNGNGDDHDFNDHNCASGMGVIALFGCQWGIEYFKGNTGGCHDGNNVKMPP